MKLSIVIPAYNEERRIAPTLLDLQAYLGKQNYNYEIIVVVNGCTDQTYHTAKKLADSWPEKIIVRLLDQPGKGNAVKRGVLDQASGDLVLFMDADNATPVSEIEKFFSHFRSGYQVVIGSRYLNPGLMRVPPPFYRVVLSRLSNRLIRFLAVPGIVDTQLGFKAFTRQAALDIFPFLTVERWAFDIEILAVALNRGHKIKEVPVLWHEPGGSHVSMRAYSECLVDLIKIKLRALQGKYQ